MNSEIIPEDLNIIFGRQGTFAGRSMGYSIEADGRVTRWEGKYPGEIEQANAAISEDELRRIWKRIEAIGFLEMSYQAMTTEGPFMNVTAGGESRRVTWTGQSDDLPAGVQDLYDDVMDVARTALGEAEAGESN